MTTPLNGLWHHLTKAEVNDLLNAHPDTGLGKFDIDDHRQKFGPNTLTIKMTGYTFLQLDFYSYCNYF